MTAVVRRESTEKTRESSFRESICHAPTARGYAEFLRIRGLSSSSIRSLLNTALSHYYYQVSPRQKGLTHEGRSSGPDVGPGAVPRVPYSLLPGINEAMRAELPTAERF